MGKIKKKKMKQDIINFNSEKLNSIKTLNIGNKKKLKAFIY